MAASAKMEGNKEAMVYVSGISFLLCLSVLIVNGIVSWIRKRASFEWWRDKCGCLGGSGDGGTPSQSYAYATKAPSASSSETNSSGYIQTLRAQGLDNPSFEPQAQQFHGSALRDEGQSVRMPEIKIKRAPPAYHSLYPSESRHSTASRNAIPLSRAGTGRHKKCDVVSKPSIASGYASDVDSECSQVSRIPTVGRCSNRKMADKRKRRRKRNAKFGARGHTKSRKLGTNSFENFTSIDLREPVERRHSLAVSYQREHQSIKNSCKPVHQTTTKRKRWSSEANLMVSNRHAHPHAEGSTEFSGSYSQTSSLCRSASSTFDRTAATRNRQNLGEMRLKSNSQNPLTSKSTSLVRSETILEVPIYFKQSRPASARVGINKAEAKCNHRDFRDGKKAPRSKPPRTRAGRECEHARRSESHSDRSSWQYGYGSVPADFGKIKSRALEQLGMTPKALMGSLDKLDFEKLSQPVLSISEEQRQASPRKSVVDSEMTGHEREILKNTYKLGESEIMTTDL